VIPDPLGDSVRWLAGGGLLAYPTETVWGLGADATSDAAVGRLLRWKGRGGDSPLSIVVDTSTALENLGIDVSRGAYRVAAAFWPGPITLVLRCPRRFAAGVARADGAIGVRCSSHPLAAAIARRLRAEGVGPMTATSLNRSGDPAARSRAQAVALCGEGDDMPRMVDVDQAESGGDEPSTVLDLTGAAPKVLRWGALPAEALNPVLEELPGS
jgi:tRNA threonylcarbamoyl adenosine modification protein (Sua5/YciO/YrdC/YwlC family)